MNEQDNEEECHDEHVDRRFAMVCKTAVTVTGVVICGLSMAFGVPAELALPLMITVGGAGGYWTAKNKD